MLNTPWHTLQLTTEDTARGTFSTGLATVGTTSHDDKIFMFLVAVVAVSLDRGHISPLQGWGLRWWEKRWQQEVVFPAHFPREVQNRFYRSTPQCLWYTVLLLDICRIGIACGCLSLLLCFLGFFSQDSTAIATKRTVSCYTLYVRDVVTIVALHMFVRL